MTRKEKTQENRFATKIAPILDQLAILCERFNMPMVAAVQLFENEETGARVATQATLPKEMSLPLSISVSLMNGSTKVSVENNTLQLLVPKGVMPDNLKQYSETELDTEIDEVIDEIDTIIEHAKHCEDCAELMQDYLGEAGTPENNLTDLIEELKKSKLPFVFPKNNNIH